MTVSTTADREAPRKRTRNAADSREKLIKAGRAEFAQNGFAGARTERICARAKSNPRMISHYFGGKSGLYLAVLEEALGDLRRQELKIDVEHLDPVEGLMQLFDFMNSHFAKDRELVRLLSGENILKAKTLKTSKRVAGMASPVLQAISRLLERGESDGTVRAGLDPLYVYVTMVALNQFHLSNVHTLSVIFQQNLDTPDWRAGQHQMARLMVQNFLRRHQTEAGS